MAEDNVLNFAEARKRIEEALRSPPRDDEEIKRVMAMLLAVVKPEIIDVLAAYIHGILDMSEDSAKIADGDLYGRQAHGHHRPAGRRNHALRPVPRCA
jgi:hypothetical protein